MTGTRIVTLTPQEMYVSSLVGVRRRLASTGAGKQERNGADRLDNAAAWYMNVVGAQGECAAAKALGLYWPASINAAKSEPDIPPDWQVKTLAKDHYDLIVRPNDVMAHRYILVTGDGPSFRVHGWIRGADACRDEWWKDRGGRDKPAWWVPQSHLLPIPEREAVTT